MKSKKQMLNDAFQKEGFASLESPRDLLAQIAVMIEDHDDFRRLLATTEPERRTDAYLSLRSRLRFTPKSLEEYLTEINNSDSEKASRVRKVNLRLEGRAEDAINRADEIAAAKGSLEMVCKRCTVSACFLGETKIAAVVKAGGEGWAYVDDGEEQYELCPKCAALRPSLAGKAGNA